MCVPVGHHLSAGAPVCVAGEGHLVGAAVQVRVLQHCGDLHRGVLLAQPVAVREEVLFACDKEDKDSIWMDGLRVLR